MRRNPLIIEIVTGVAALLFLVYTMRSMLLFHQTFLCHDNVLWFYTLFHFSAENIINGNYPLWNPFTHGGEPFYPILLLCKLLTPIPLLTIYFGKFITTDTGILFVWHYFIQMVTMAFGTYIVLRIFTRHLFVRLTLIPILLYSSFFLVSLRQFGFLALFIWVPYITYFLLRIVYNKDYRWHNWLILAVFVGFNWQSYLFVGVWVFILFVSCGFLFFRRDLLKELVKSKGVIPKLSVMVIIVLAMMLPNLVTLMEKDKFIFPARMHNVTDLDEEPMYGPQQFEGGSADRVEGINMSYNVISKTGTFSTIWDFIQIISPDGNPYVGMPDRERWGRPSEAYMYLGILPWAIAILGMVMGKHDIKRVWLLILIGFGLLMLGPPGGLHKVLYYVYPPLWFIRHTHLFVLFFVFAFLYFYILGFNYIYSVWGKPLLSSDVRKRAPISFFVVIAFSFCIVASIYWIIWFENTQTYYLFVCFIFLFIVGWLLRKRLGRKGLYISLIISHISIVMIYTTNGFKFQLYILFVFGIPLLLFLLCKKILSGFSDKAKYGVTITLLAVFAISLTGDLIYSFRQSRKLYLGQPHPGLVFNVNTNVQKSLLSQKRFVVPNSLYCTTGQSMRSASLLYRQSYVFSPLYLGYEFPGIHNSELITEPVISSIRNGSFESWVTKKDGSLLPEHLIYHQDGKEGFVERCALGAKDGKYSVLLNPSSTGNSFLRFQIKNVEELKGQYIRFSVWVKSQNNTPNAVQIDLQDSTGVVSAESYSNSKNWERVEVLKYIDEEVSELFVTCNVKHNATAGAYFDGAIIELSGKFEYALKVRRWNCLFGSWAKINDGSLLPEHFIYHQDGNEGFVERHVLDAKDCKYSVLITPSSIGNSFIRFQAKNIEELQGQYIRFSVWVKSQNKTPNAVQVDLQDGICVPGLYQGSYNNSGNWERLDMLKYIDGKASELFVTCNVKYNATAGAYFAGATIELSGKFEYALKVKRWNCLLLPKRYFELIHSDIPALAMSNMFAVGKPIFQFKHGAIAADDEEAIELLKGLGDKKSVQLLDDYVIVDSQINSSDSKLIVPVNEYGKRSRACSSTEGENSGFAFSINRYEYNSVDMKVSTDKDGILYWSDGYDSNWKAYTNGKKASIHRANINFKAIALPKGENNVRFVYKPVLFIISLFVFYGSLIMSSFAALVIFIKYRKCQ
jgi:hypothetical protein